jgi:hypothetical protein
MAQGRSVMSVAIGLLAAIGISCRHSSSQKHPTTRLSSDEIEALRGFQKPVIKENAPTLVAAGPLPLLHLFESGGSIRVLDATSQRALAAVTIAPGTIVSVSPEGGVIVGREKILSQRLAADHRYEIWWEAKK